MMKQRPNEFCSESNSTEDQTSVQLSAQQIDPSLSPITRRKHEFRLARLQSEVMTRARSTLFGLGDVWKSKMNGLPQTLVSAGSLSTPPRSPKNQNAVKNTFDFFFPRKNKEASNVKIRKGNSENNLSLSQKSRGNSGKIRSSEKQSKEHKTDLKPETKSLKRDTRSRKFSRNQSVDNSGIFSKENNDDRIASEIMSRSFDDGIHYLSDGFDDFRPRSYNDTFSFLDEFDNETRSIYDGDSIKRRPKEKYSEKPLGSPQSRHILFNDEDDVIFFKSSSCPDKSSKKSERHNFDQAPISPKPLPNTKDIPGILHTRGNSQNSKSQDGLPYKLNSLSKVPHAEKIISARLKIQPPSAKDSNSKTSNSLRHGQSKVLQGHKNDILKYDSLDREIHPENTQGLSNLPHRNISTVIIEEQERVITPGENERKSLQKLSTSEFTSKDNRKGVKKQPSFDLEHEYASTLPRAVSSHRKANQATLQTKREEDVQNLSYNGEGQGVQRCSSLDLELESQAMKIVRTVGQAFEVCHKLSMENNSYTDDPSEQSISEHERCSPEPLSDMDESRKEPASIAIAPQVVRPNHLDIIPTTHMNFNTPPKKIETGEHDDQTPDSPNSYNYKQLKEQLEQQSLQTRQALAQLMLVREQLITETNARIEAQARTQQLLQQNRELLEHIAAIAGYQDSDRNGVNITSGNIGLAPQPAFSTLSLSTPGSSGINVSPFSTLNKQLQPSLATLNLQNTLASINQLQNLNQQRSQGANQNAEMLAQQEIYNLNQELLNKLQNLSLLGQFNPGFNAGNTANTTTNQFSYLYGNQQAIGSQNSSPSCGSVTPTANQLNNNRNQSYMTTPLNFNKLGLSVDENLDNLTPTTTQASFNSSKQSCESSQFIRPLSQIGTMTTVNYDGKVKVIVPVTEYDENGNSKQKRDAQQNQKNEGSKISIPGIVTTDERGTLKRMASAGSSCGSATPSFITRSSSEKVPSRSQMMTEMQRTQWARHTTK